MKIRLAALKTFYTELTPEQQTLLNKRMAEFEQKRQHRHWGHGDSIPNGSSAKTDQTSQ